MRQGRRDAASKRPSGSYSHRTRSRRARLEPRVASTLCSPSNPANLRYTTPFENGRSRFHARAGPADDAVVTRFGPDAVDAHVEAGVAVRVRAVLRLHARDGAPEGPDDEEG